MKAKLIKSIGFGLLVLVLLVFIGFVEKKSSERQFNEIHVTVQDISDVYFVDEADILETLKVEFPLLTPGMAMSEFDLKKIEDKVEMHPFVKNAEVFVDLKGNIWVEIQQHIPMARIARPMAADGYISTEGLILPTSSKYTTRVLVIEGEYADELLEAGDLSQEHGDLLELIRYMYTDPFWNAQITGLDINRKKEIILHQQVGRQIIEFGDAKDIGEKFKRISLFYEKILPVKGWEAYDRVNVKYKDQIICE